MGLLLKAPPHPLWMLFIIAHSIIMYSCIYNILNIVHMSGQLLSTYWYNHVATILVFYGFLFPVAVIIF